MRAALEQTYGTFVSSNTQLVNDELVKDEIVSVSSGNIEKYSEISTDTLKDGSISVSLQATVSIGKLVDFARSKGNSTELAGATFMMNIKLKELNKKNEIQALSTMLTQLFYISDLNLFDFSITPTEPIRVDGYTDFYRIPVTIKIKPNKNYSNMKDLFVKTINTLSLSSTEIADYTKSNINIYYPFRYENYIFNRTISGNYNNVALRNDIKQFLIQKRNWVDVLRDKISKSSIAFQIIDNLGNKSIPVINTIITKMKMT